MKTAYSHIWNTTFVGANDTGITVTLKGLKKYEAYVRAFSGKGDGKFTKGYMSRTDEDSKEWEPTVYLYPRGLVTDYSLNRLIQLSRRVTSFPWLACIDLWINAGGC